MKQNSPLSLCYYLYHNIASLGHRKTFWLLTIANIVMAIAELAVAGCVSLLGLSMAVPEKLQTLPFFVQIFNLDIARDTSMQLRVVAIVLAFVVISTVLKNIFLAGLTWKQTCFSQTMASVTIASLYKMFLYAPYSWHLDQRVATMQQHLFWKGQVSGFVVGALTLITQFVVVMFLLLGAMAVGKIWALFFFMVIGAIGYLLHRAVKYFSYRIGKEAQEIDIYCANLTQQSIVSIKEVFIYDRRLHLLKLYTNVQPKLIKNLSLINFFSPLPLWVLESVGMILLLLVFLFLIFSGQSAGSSIGILMTLTATAWRLLPAANKALSAVFAIKAVLPQVESIILMLKDHPKESENAREVVSFNNSIELQNVNYYYPNSNNSALKDISFYIGKGQSVGIIGKSGAGKSTLLNILCGLVSPSKGSVCFDGHVIDANHVRLRIGYVPQHIQLFNASLAENIAFSRLGEPLNEDRVLECCKMAAIDFIDSLPEGIHSSLGENGVRLSGGQLQRVGIARALYDCPDLLVFDEATSALDTATEAEIQATISALKANVTILIIAHRLSTVRECDVIYWIDNGKVKMVGDQQNILAGYEQFQIKRKQK